MSMLAERKQKQRWFLNPRANKEWAQDSNKFGQKMLEKMGWSAGKGLGANEDGITEHIKVKYKNDIQGIGYQLRDDQWTQHENNFTQLLANLGGVSEPTKIDTLIKPEKSLEKKSQKSRARVHYHKFTRGKDLASKSEKDLANIFGRKTLEKPVKKEEKDESDNEGKTFGVVTIKSGNMADYFKSKLEKLGDKFSSFSKKEENDEESESEISKTSGFGFSSSTKEENVQNFMSFISSNTKSVEKDDPINNKQNIISFVSSTPLNEEKGAKRKREEDEDPPKKKKNKKKKNVAFDNKGNNIDLIEEVCYDNPCLNKEDSNNEEKFEDGGLTNLAFDPNDEPKTSKSVTFASPLAEYSTINDDSPKKKKKKKKKQQLGLDNPACEVLNETAELENKQPKNKKRKSVESIDEEVTVKKSKKKNIENIPFEETPIAEPKKSKKKKNMKGDLVSEENIPKKNKKKKKENGITNFGCEESPNCVENLACSVDLIEEGIESITNAIDNYQSELENEMNIKKDKKLKQKKSKRSLEANN